MLFYKSPIAISRKRKKLITLRENNHLLVLRTFALIVYAHPYCARNSCRNATPRHASSARAEETFQPHIG